MLMNPFLWNVFCRLMNPCYSLFNVFHIPVTLIQPLEFPLLCISLFYSLWPITLVPSFWMLIVTISHLLGIHSLAYKHYDAFVHNQAKHVWLWLYPESFLQVVNNVDLVFTGVHKNMKGWRNVFSLSSVQTTFLFFGSGHAPTDKISAHTFFISCA